ncbi:MAG: CopG family transcriptional regulator [Candidatus Aminicenantes bacterium]|nr:CopG family transcriptional regulator [Candidatus Aminicenantes bacterium]
MPTKMKALLIYIDEKEKERLQFLAKKNGLSLSKLIRLILKNFLDDTEKYIRIL